MQLRNDCDLQLCSGYEWSVFTLKAIQVLLFVTLIMICESKTLKNNIFLELQCTCISAQGIVGLFWLVFTREAVNKESTHPPTQVKKKIVWVVQHCYPKPSFSVPGKYWLRPLSNIIPISYLNWAWMRVLCNRWILFKSPNRLSTFFLLAYFNFYDVDCLSFC